MTDSVPPTPWFVADLAAALAVFPAVALVTRIQRRSQETRDDDRKLASLHAGTIGRDDVAYRRRPQTPASPGGSPMSQEVTTCPSHV